MYWFENLRFTYWFMSEVLPTLCKENRDQIRKDHGDRCKKGAPAVTEDDDLEKELLARRHCSCVCSDGNTQSASAIKSRAEKKIGKRGKDTDTTRHSCRSHERARARV